MHISATNNSSETQCATPDDRQSSITGKTLNDRQVSSTHMVRHNFHTANHGEGIVHVKWFIPYTIEVKMIKVKVIYHTRIETNTIIEVNDHTCIFSLFFS